MAPAEEATNVERDAQANAQGQDHGTVVEPQDPAGVVTDPWAALLQVGTQLVAALSAASDAQAPPHPWIARDPSSGERHLKIPLSQPQTMRQLADTLSGLAQALRGPAKT